MNLAKKNFAANFCCKLWVFLRFCIFFSVPQCVGHSFAYVAHLCFFWDVRLQTQRAVVAITRATNLAMPSTYFSTYQERHKHEDCHICTEAIFCCVQATAWVAGTRTAGTCTPGIPPVLSSGNFLHTTIGKIVFRQNWTRKPVLATTTVIVVGWKSSFFLEWRCKCCQRPAALDL